MEKKPEVDGRWVDIEADQMIARMEDVKACELLALRSIRIELGSDDRDRFVAKFSKMAEDCADEIDGMDDSQKSFYIFRKMLVD